MNLTVRDKKSPTGLRLHLPAKAMPTNKSGKRIAPATTTARMASAPARRSS